MKEAIAIVREALVWDREHAFMFASMTVAAYAWIATEKLFTGVAVGVAMHAIQATAYEILATRFGWQRLEIAESFRVHVLPHLLHLISKVQRA